jgi:hypothetical protein
MVEAARAKARASKSTATFECGPVQDLPAEGPRFDVVISNFGALNCLPLATWVEIVPALLSPSGRGHVVLMGRRPLPEGLRRGFSASARGEVAEVRIGDSSVTVHYDSAAAVKKALATSVTVTRVEALGCLVPGPGYEAFAQDHAILVGLLAMGECALRRAPFFQGRGDHTLFEFRR